MYKIPATTLFLGKNLIFMPECHSTNDHMLHLCQQGRTPPEGALVITANQTAGKGQRGNTWESEPGKNLTFTLLLKPEFLAVTKQFYLNMSVALGIRDFLTGLTDRKVQIKWPNDILVDQKKICGILIENQLAGARFKNSLVGIGLNINQQQFANGRATSLALITNLTFDLSTELNNLLSFLEARYLQLRAGMEQRIKSDYLGNLFRFNEESPFSDQDGDFNGTIVGLDDTGRLQVRKSDGVASYNLKEIRFI